MGSGQPLLDSGRLGTLRGLQEEHGPGRGQGQDIRTGTVLRQTNARSPHGNDQTEGETRGLQRDPIGVRLSARQVLVQHNADCGRRPRVGSLAIGRHFALPAHLGSNDRIWSSDHLQLG